MGFRILHSLTLIGQSLEIHVCFVQVLLTQCLPHRRPTASRLAGRGRLTYCILVYMYVKLLL